MNEVNEICGCYYIRRVSEKELIDRAICAATVLRPAWLAVTLVEKQLRRKLTQEEMEYFGSEVTRLMEEKQNDNAE